MEGRDTDGSLSFEDDLLRNRETLTNLTARTFSSYLPKHIDLPGATELFIQIERCTLDASFLEKRPLLKQLMDSQYSSFF